MADETKRYSDREVALIVRAALDIEKNEYKDEAGGLLLSEIEEIAQETGISVEHIRLAINEIVGHRKKNRARLLFGGETSFESIDIIPHALTQDELERLNQSLPVLTNLSESSVANGGTLTWTRSILKSFLDGFPLRLSVKQGKKGTEIEASANLKSMASVLFAASSGLGVLAGMKLAVFSMLLLGVSNFGMPMSLLFLSLGGLVGFGGFWLLARVAFRSFVKRSREKVATIVDKIKTMIEAMHE